MKKIIVFLSLIVWVLGSVSAVAETDTVEDSDIYEDLKVLSKIPEPIKRITPKYPKHELQFKINGFAAVVFVVDELGTVTQAAVEECSREVFGQSALEAVLQWKFKPGIKDGVAVKTRVRLPCVFTPPRKRVWPK